MIILNRSLINGGRQWIIINSKIIVINDNKWWIKIDEKKEHKEDK